MYVQHSNSIFISLVGLSTSSSLYRGFGVSNNPASNTWEEVDHFDFNRNNSTSSGSAFVAGDPKNNTVYYGGYYVNRK